MQRRSRSVGGSRDYSSVTEVTSKVLAEAVLIEEVTWISGKRPSLYRSDGRSSVFTSLVELVVMSCVELLRSCGINILVVFSDIPVF